MKEALRSMTEDMMAMIRRKDFAPFNLALSGGETAKHMFSLWVDEYKDKIDWNNIRFFWVDERCVPPTSPDSNYGHANHLLFKPLCIPADHIHRIKGENEPGTEAMRYSWVVKEFLPLFNQMPTFDCIILGVGEDSHTASIFSTTMELLSDSRNYAVSQQPSTGQYRITMTGPLILNGQGTRNPEALQGLFSFKRHACRLYLIACRTGYDLWAEPMILLHAELFPKTCTCFRKNTYIYSSPWRRYTASTLGDILHRPSKYYFS